MRKPLPDGVECSAAIRLLVSNGSKRIGWTSELFESLTQLKGSRTIKTTAYGTATAFCRRVGQNSLRPRARFNRKATAWDTALNSGFMVELRGSPVGAYSPSGGRGQYAMIILSHKAVIVRCGFDAGAGFKIEKFCADVLAAID